jgi:CheY-like chemotaxis protein
VLVVEDEPITRTIVHKMLSTFDLVVDEAATGAAALEMLAAQPYELVFLDVHLPDIDGLEVCRTWRTATDGATAADVAILALTADRRGADVAPCLAAGMNAHLSKPIGLPALADALTRWLPTNVVS